ncbi:uncharacterized protein K460DRAFT_401601 [Cucurbitaria berberidis CBS 394.84]|uniref:DUF7732 domain-containing protein n=1 Tax=Cucurbitaria berberidis CBS 394.84 TaxID=1168544 RepID=A0A9P4LD85_9PLEO|nr:uncharacterized protein K460DRAFT_401601 [Cucurbitaria berberidis CBS 394.84]KAF1851586.1 hypothetical protein K460DRAFT_401601 [Cucurbitaria berberidis CBS 394.84]
MKVSQAFTLFALATQAISATSIPRANDVLIAVEQPRSVDVVSPDHTLEKRKGGGGRGGGSSGGGRSGSSSGGSSRTGSSSLSGGSTRAGSGPSRAFGGGRYYGGGAAVPYSAGSRTPKGLIAGALIAPIAILAIMPGIWLYNVYPYNYNNPYRFRNQSAVANRTLSTRETGANETLPVKCLCQEFSVCGCDENEDQQYLTDLVGNGSYAALNKTLITVSDIDGIKTLVLNGTLPNGTTAPGGADDDEGAAVHLALGKYTGYWAMGLIVLYGVFV